MVRYKIKSVPWHEDSPKREGKVCRSIPSPQYFEAHLQYELSEVMMPDHFETIVRRFKGAYMSRNPFKLLDRGWVQMVTLRLSDCNMYEFNEAVKYLKESLTFYKHVKVK